MSVPRYQAGTTTRDLKAGETLDDPLSDAKRQYEQQVERELLGVWREFGRKFINALRQHPETQAKGLVGDVLGLGLWGELSKRLTGVLLPRFEDMLGDASKHALEQLPFDIGVDRDAIHADVADWARDYVGELITGVNGTTKDRVRTAVANWAEAGEAMPALERRMHDIFDAQWRAKMIAVTETTRAFAHAKEKTWKESRVVKKKRWQTAADDRRCPLCAELQGVTRGLGKAFPGGIDNPPRHPSCRCWLTPVGDWD